jgi:hypothetical protein
MNHFGFFDSHDSTDRFRPSASGANMTSRNPSIQARHTAKQAITQMAHLSLSPNRWVLAMGAALTLMLIGLVAFIGIGH